MNYIYKTIIILLFLSLFSCGDDENESKINSVIDSEFEKYLVDFISEADARGVQVNKQNLLVNFVDRLSSNEASANFACGFGWWDFEGKGIRKVEILETDGCWNSKTEIQKENLMFHEFGHALLGRPHDEKEFPGGYAGSLMCSASCSGFRVYHQNLEMRSYYLDELFNRATNFPEWISNEKLLSNLFNGENFDESTHLWDFQRGGDLANLSDYNFTISPAGVFQDASLAVSVGNDPIENSSFWILKNFPLENINNCPSMKASVKIKSADFGEGTVQIGLFIIDGNGKTINSYRTTNSNVFSLQTSTEIRTKLLCIPENAKECVVFLRVLPANKSTVYMDDLMVTLWE